VLLSGSEIEDRNRGAGYRIARRGATDDAA